MHSVWSLWLASGVSKTLPWIAYHCPILFPKVGHFCSTICQRKRSLIPPPSFSSCMAPVGHLSLTCLSWLSGNWNYFLSAMVLWNQFLLSPPSHLGLAVGGVAHSVWSLSSYFAGSQHKKVCNCFPAPCTYLARSRNPVKSHTFCKIQSDWGHHGPCEKCPPLLCTHQVQSPMNQRPSLMWISGILHAADSSCLHHGSWPYASHISLTSISSMMICHILFVFTVALSDAMLFNLFLWAIAVHGSMSLFFSFLLALFFPEVPHAHPRGQCWLAVSWLVDCPVSWWSHKGYVTILINFFIWYTWMHWDIWER